MPPYVTKLDPMLHETLRDGLVAQGFELFCPPHTVFAGKKPGISIALYQSGKLVIQGKGMAEFIQFYLEPEILGTFAFGQVDKTPRIGCDEAGKGDYFGPLCVAGVYADERGVEALIEMGVRDSKSMQDSKIRALAKQIAKRLPFHVLRLHPAKYNELYEKFGNLNHMLAWAHSAVIETLHKKTGCQRVIVDQFASQHVLEKAVRKKELILELIQRTKGESDVVVAAGSILARAAFVYEMDGLSKKLGMTIPKGAFNGVKSTGKKLVAAHGKDILRHVAKLHFKTTNEILD